MAITDLTGTTWIFNERINLASCPANGHILLLNITANNFNYNKLYANASVLYYGYSTASYNSVYTTSSYWSNSANRVITINGGTAATNASLISWLQQNARSEIYAVKKPALVATADAIRAKGETSAQIEWTENGFADAITNMVVPIPSDYGHISWDGSTLTVS